ncbi:MAG TPA: hypothetical protein DEO59_16855 [Balneola sp.]|nr:hypothetical protein [Balneola sp.]
MSEKNDPLKTIGLASAMFDIMTQDDDEANVKYRARFYKTNPLLDFPDDWDDLLIEEKKRRLDALDKIALDKGVSDDN